MYNSRVWPAPDIGESGRVILLAATWSRGGDTGVRIETPMLGAQTNAAIRVIMAAESEAIGPALLVILIGKVSGITDANACRRHR